MPIRDMFNPITPALATAPTIPATGVATLNQTGTDCMVYLVGGTLTTPFLQLTPPGGAATQVTGAAALAGGVLVPSGWSITWTGSAAPTSWVWIAI